MIIKDEYINDFVNLYSEVKEIKELREKVIEKKTDTFSKMLIDRVLDFIKDYHLKGDNPLFEQQIIYNFWNMLYLYFFQKTFSIQRSDKTLKDYINCCSRILEFALFINNNSIEIIRNNEKLDIKNVYFNSELIDLCFYMHFLEIQDEIRSHFEELIMIKKAPKVRCVIINGKYQYEPFSKPMADLRNKNKKTFWFERHFRLENDQIKKIFEEKGSSGSVGGNGSNKGYSGKFNDFEIHEIVENYKYSKDVLDETPGYEEKKERKNQLAYFKPIVYDKDMQKALGIKINHNYKLDKYKMHLIDKAISNTIAKNEMFLKSRIVNFSIFKKIINILLHIIEKDEDLTDKNSSENLIKNKDIIRIILISVFTGIQVKILILIFANACNDIEFDKHFKKLFIRKDRIFADDVYDKDDILYPIKNRKLEISLPKYLTNLLQSIEYNFKEQIINLSEEDCKDYINNITMIFSKTLNTIIKKSEFSNLNILDIKSCHKAFYNYFKLFHSETDLRVLIFNNISKSDETRLCYTSQPKRAYYYETWLNESYNRLTSNNVVLESFYEVENIGSKKVFKPHIFKNFLLNLTYLASKSKDLIQQSNLKMIYIRYSLSLLLATRKGFESCNLSNFSEELGLLIIHEKAKTINSSRRLIGLNKRAISIIQLFYELKQELNINTNIPVLLKKENEKIVEVELNQNSVRAYIEEFHKHEKYEEIFNFINVVDLNFGRHVFATEILRRGFERNYGNEMLGHTSKGNSIFGTYSCLNIKEYIRRTKEFMDEIEKKYFPRITRWV